MCIYFSYTEHAEQNTVMGGENEIFKLKNHDSYQKMLEQ